MTRLPSLSLLALIPLLACGDKDGTEPDVQDDTGVDDTAVDDTGELQDIALLGSWVDNWGASHEVSNETWTSGASAFAITQYDNDEAFLIAQNDADNAWNPELWSRIDWAWSEGDLMVCQTAYDKATEEEALATPAADSTDAAAGCGGFSWTLLRAPLSLTGSWDDNWSGHHEVDAFQWASGDSLYAITQAGETWAVAQNGADNPWSPGLWSRFDWASVDGGLYACQTAYAAESEQDAVDTPAADPADLQTGCGGFAWNALRASLSINGSWADGWGGTHTVNAWVWTSGESTFGITQANDSEGWLVAQNGADNAWSPSLWSRFDWTWDGSGALYYCQTAYDAATEEDALNTAAADGSDPSEGGCGDFAWSSLETL